MRTDDELKCSRSATVIASRAASIEAVEPPSHSNCEATSCEAASGSRKAPSLFDGYALQLPLLEAVGLNPVKALIDTS